LPAGRHRRILEEQMRCSRLVVVRGVMAIALMGMGWRLLASRHTARAAQAPVRTTPSQLRPSLEWQLQQLLAHRPPVPPDLAPLAAGPCFVALGRCSQIPCVEFARAGRAQGSAAALARAAAAAAAAPSAVVLELARATRPGQSLQSSCQGRRGAPRILRVGAP
jgi:hypothetical protein